MYQKFKYIIIGTIILIIVVTVLTMDAGSRYNSINHEKEGLDSQQSQEQNYNTVLQQQQNTDILLTQQQKALLNKSNVSSLSEEQEEEISRSDFEAKKASLKRRKRPVYTESLTEDPPAEEVQETNEDKNNTTAIDSKGYLTDNNGIRTDEYTLHQFFNAGDDVYAIVTSDKVYNGSNYLTRKFYIYKMIDKDLYRSSYLFDYTEPITADKKSKNITVNVTTNNIDIYYTGKTKITRSFSPLILKNNYKQYSSIPVLKYVTDEDKKESSDTKEHS